MSEQQEAIKAPKKKILIVDLKEKKRSKKGKSKQKWLYILLIQIFS